MILRQKGSKSQSIIKSIYNKGDLSLQTLVYKFVRNYTYSWHDTQEHWWSSQGSITSSVIIAILIVIALTILSNGTGGSNPGARSSQKKLLWQLRHIRKGVGIP